MVRCAIIFSFGANNTILVQLLLVLVQITRFWCNYH
jgi:hypothetical protein